MVPGTKYGHASAIQRISSSALTYHSEDDFHRNVAKLMASYPLLSSGICSKTPPNLRTPKTSNSSKPYSVRPFSIIYYAVWP